VTVSELLAEHTPYVAGIACRLREVVKETLPEVEERVYLGWHGIGYHHPAAGYVCAIFPKSNRVELAFERGSALPDPKGLLVRGGKRVRYAVLTRLDDALEEDLKDLIEAAALAPS
jgi:hypothetical protein